MEIQEQEKVGVIIQGHSEQFVNKQSDKTGIAQHFWWFYTVLVSFCEH